MDCTRETLIPHGGKSKMETKLGQIAEKAKTSPQLVFTSIAHLIDEEMLERCIFLRFRTLNPAESGQLFPLKTDT